MAGKTEYNGNRSTLGRARHAVFQAVQRQDRPPVRLLPAGQDRGPGDRSLPEEGRYGAGGFLSVLPVRPPQAGASLPRRPGPEPAQ